VEAASRLDSSGKMDLDAVGLSDQLQDDAFLNEVQASVSNWIVQIRKVTVLPGSTPFPSGDSAETESHADLEEVSFWIGLEEALKTIRVELNKPEVLLTVALLKAAKRFVATIALENNTNLDAAEAHTSDVANFLRSYPAPTLAAARDWSKIGSAMDSVFVHLPKVRQSRFYDLDRLARLVEATTLTLRERMEGTLRESYKGNGIVLSLDYAEYENVVRGPTQDIFVMFDASFATFSEFFLDQGRIRRRAGEARNETPVQVLKGITLYHQALRERLDAVYHFRTQHEKLRSVVVEVLTGDREEGSSKPVASSGDDSGEEYSDWALREVDEAPMSLFASVDVLDLSTRGEAVFSSALEGYDRKVDAIEERLARLLRDKLASCQVSDCGMLCDVTYRYCTITHFHHFSCVSFKGRRRYVSCICSLQPLVDTFACSCCSQRVSAPTYEYCRAGSSKASVQIHSQIRIIFCILHRYHSRYSTRKWKNPMGETDGTTSPCIDEADE
jgi:dynein heavy chain 1